MALNKRAERAAYTGNTIRVVACAALTLLSTAHCNPSDESETGAMFFFKKNKSDETSVGPAVGAQLVKQAAFPEVPALPVKPAVMATTRIVKGVPPQIAFVNEQVPGETDIGFVVEGTAQRPPLALVNVQYRFEIWELEDAAKPVFARKRDVQIDPKQEDWVDFSILEIACLPNEHLLLAVEHHTPVRFGLYIYDIAANSCSKLSDVTTLGITPPTLFQSIDTFVASQFKLFSLLVVSPEEMLVLFYTGRQRLAADVYYSTPGHIYAFSSAHPQGVPVLQLSAADGVVERWQTNDNTLWLATQDFRDRKQPKSYVMSLDIRKLFSH